MLLVFTVAAAAPSAAFAATDAVTGAPMTAEVLAYPILALLLVVLAILDLCVIGARIGKAFGHLVSAIASRRG